MPCVTTWASTNALSEWRTSRVLFGLWTKWNTKKGDHQRWPGKCFPLCNWVIGRFITSTTNRNLCLLTAYVFQWLRPFSYLAFTCFNKPSVCKQSVSTGFSAFLNFTLAFSIFVSVTAKALNGANINNILCAWKKRIYEPVENNKVKIRYMIYMINKIRKHC